MEQDERPEDQGMTTFTSETLLALQRAAAALEAALRESSRLSHRDGPSDGVTA